MIYVDGDMGDSNSADMAFGTALHLALKSHFDGENAPLTFEMYWETQRGKDLKYTRFDWAQLQELGVVFINRFIKLHAKKFKPFKMEERIGMDIAGEHRIEGTPDMLGDFEGVPSIIDWKTSASPYQHKKLVVNQQMYIYAKMAEKVYGYKPQQIVYVVFVKGEERIQTLTYPLTDAKIDSIMVDVELMIKDLASRKEFPRNPNCFCANPGKCYPGEKLY